MELSKDKNNTPYTFGYVVKTHTQSHKGLAIWEGTRQLLLGAEQICGTAALLSLRTEGRQRKTESDKRGSRKDVTRRRKAMSKRFWKDGIVKRENNTVDKGRQRYAKTRDEGEGGGEGEIGSFVSLSLIFTGFHLWFFPVTVISASLFFGSDL